jgi:IS5 family transposase
MEQLGLGLNLSTKQTRKREFLDVMDRVVPWSALVQVLEPHYARADTCRPALGIETMLRLLGSATNYFVLGQWRPLQSR